MKKGDSLRVFIENVQVGRGEITAVRDGEIEVTVPGFVSVIATRTSLSEAPTSLEQNTSNREVIVTAVEKPDGTEEIVDGSVQAASLAPATAPTSDANNSQAQSTEENTEAVKTPPEASTENAGT